MEQRDAIKILETAGFEKRNQQAGSAFENGQKECLVCLESMNKFETVCVYKCTHWCCAPCTLGSMGKYRTFPCPYKCDTTNSRTSGLLDPELVDVTSETIKKWNPAPGSSETIKELKEKIKALELKLLDARMEMIEREKSTQEKLFKYVTWEDFHRMVGYEVQTALAKRKSPDDDDDEEPSPVVKKEKKF